MSNDEKDFAIDMNKFVQAQKAEIVDRNLFKIAQSDSNTGTNLNSQVTEIKNMIVSLNEGSDLIGITNFTKENSITTDDSVENNK